MAGLYVDTSALGRVLLTEPDAAAIRATSVATTAGGRARFSWSSYDD
jgi:hypothetical protein